MEEGGGWFASQRASLVTWPQGLGVEGLYPGGSVLGGSAMGRVYTHGRGGGQTPRYMGYYGIRSTSGKDVSYWNAFLLKFFFQNSPLPHSRVDTSPTTENPWTAPPSSKVVLLLDFAFLIFLSPYQCLDPISTVSTLRVFFTYMHTSVWAWGHV